jgi:3-isopropylmalate/(R)-2-methylmalate dehydratase large subunit
MGMTVIEKIIAGHADRPEVRPGEIVWMGIDVRTARDFGGANVVGHLARHYPERPVADPARTAFTFDCVVPANTIPYAENQHVCRTFARKHGVALFDVDAGIGSHVLIEQGIALPGGTVVGTDSHLNLLGAIGCFGQGMGDADIAFTFATGRTWFEVPATIRVDVVGELALPATAKDLALAIVGRLGSGGALGEAVEITGPAVERLGLAERITLCSMATEMGAISAFVRPSAEVLRVVARRAGAAGRGAAAAGVEADPDAVYRRVEVVDVSGLGPMVSLPGSPAEVRPISEVAGTRVDSVFIGSCTNGRLRDFVDAASLLGGARRRAPRRVAEGVMAKAVPATREVFTAMLEGGLVRTLHDAGFIVSHSGCGGCASGQIGMTGKGEVQVSTSNRNFRGKQGAGETYLASPLVAAASALAGRLAAPEAP